MSVRVLPPPEEVAEAPAPALGARIAAFRLPPLFLAVVVAPVVLAAIYLLFIATPMYVSEARFLVKQPQQTMTEPSTGLGGVLQTIGLGQQEDETYAVHEWVMSRDAIAYLERRLDLRAMLARPGADPLERFPRPFESASQEELYRAFPRFVSIGHDSITGVSTLKVQMFRPQDAQAVASALLDGGEALINRLNDRAREDAVAQSEREVIDAQAQVAQAEQALTAYRNAQGVVDPTRSSTAELELTTKLAGDLASLQAERAGLAAVAPKDPQLPILDTRIRAYAAQVAAQNAKMAGEASSLAPKIGQYEQLDLKRQFAEKLLASASASLETARQDAARKRLYLERVVNPGAPDAPTLPRRFATLLLIAVSCLLAYGTILLINAGLKEHRQ